MHHSETTNGKLAEVRARIETLINWADADAQHARENDAAGVAKDDDRRAKKLRKALAHINKCER